MAAQCVVVPGVHLCKALSWDSIAHLLERRPSMQYSHSLAAVHVSGRNKHGHGDEGSYGSGVVG